MAAMAPPGGGRNDITSRLIRHTNVFGINEFDDSTMLKIFTHLMDSHFNQGYDAQFVRIGRVSD